MFSWVSTFLKNRVSNNMHFLVDTLGVSCDFFTLQLLFLNSKKGGSTTERSSKSGTRIEISITRTSQRCPFRPKRVPKRSVFGSTCQYRFSSAAETGWRSAPDAGPGKDTRQYIGSLRIGQQNREPSRVLRSQNIKRNDDGRSYANWQTSSWSRHQPMTWTSSSW